MTLSSSRAIIIPISLLILYYSIFKVSILDIQIQGTTIYFSYIYLSLVDLFTLPSKVNSAIYYYFYKQLINAIRQLLSTTRPYLQCFLAQLLDYKPSKGRRSPQPIPRSLEPQLLSVTRRVVRYLVSYSLSLLLYPYSYKSFGVYYRYYSLSPNPIEQGLVRDLLSGALPLPSPYRVFIRLGGVALLFTRSIPSQGVRSLRPIFRYTIALAIVGVSGIIKVVIVYIPV